MARRHTTRTTRRAFTRRMKPIAHAALLALTFASVHEVAMAQRMHVKVASPYAAMAARAAYSVTPTNINAKPANNALPDSYIALTDANGNQVNIAKSGDTRGVMNQSADGKALSTLDLTQSTSKSIVLFNSFDIGANAAVRVNMTQGSSSSALYQINNATNPTQIFGSLSSNGELFLINQNGILFGRGSQVNVQGLFASPLRVDEQNYLGGFKDSLDGGAPTFTWGGGNATYAPGTAYVKLEGPAVNPDGTVTPGAQITTGSGGRVFLLGRQVENAGTITSPGGQVVLAAGSKAYLSQPTASDTPIYMSEANEKVPTVKGLLVEVDGGHNSSEFATNAESGLISTPTGNTTIVGWAVNQMGRVRATTSVTQNGSVYLLAHSGTSGLGPNIGSQVTHFKPATVGGVLTLGSNSSIEISPDTATDKNGQPVTAAANAVFTPSRVELSGQTIEMLGGASIVAHGGNVNARASLKPQYSTANSPDKGALLDGADATGRILVHEGASVDVSGTIDTTVSAARNFVTTALLGAQDLKDAPVQKDGPIYRSELTFDIRSGSPILSDTSSYTQAVKQTAGEFLSKGGNVVLSATGGVALSAGSSINVSGGAVNYLDAFVSPSILYGADGKSYTLNTAPADVEIVGILGKQKGETTRFGIVPPGNLDTLGVAASGYTDGKDAGSLSVSARVAQLDGQLKGGTVTSVRQKAGQDKLAANGVLRLGTSSNTSGGETGNIGGGIFSTAVLQDLVITKHAGANVDVDKDEAISRVSADQINASGFGQLLFTADDRIEQQTGADLNLPALSTVIWQTTGQTTIGANIVSKGGAVTAASYDAKAAQVVSRGVMMKSGSLIDVSGNWVNQRLDGTSVAAAVVGGTINLLSDHDLVVEGNTRMTVSGGVTVSKSATFSGTAAGSIALKGMNGGGITGKETVQISSNAQLEGYAMGKGGSLIIQAGHVTVNGGAGGLTNADTGTADLNVGSGFFNLGGFQSFDLNGIIGLTINSDARVAPVMSVWQARASGLVAATGSNMSSFVQLDKRPSIVRNPVNLTFRSTGVGANQGVLAMRGRAGIDASPLANVAFKATHSIDLDGSVRASGGTISAEVATGDLDDSGKYHIALGGQAVLDVSGSVMYTPTTNGLLQGRVIDGGTISLRDTPDLVSSAYDTSISIDKDARLLADGASGALDFARTKGKFGAFYTRKVVASNGGNINISAGSGGAVLGGRMSARAGNASALGGTLNLSLGVGATNRTAGGLVGEGHIITVQDAAVEGASLQANRMTVSTAALDGFDNLYLSSLDEIHFEGDATSDHKVTLGLPSHLRLDAHALSASGGANVVLSAGSTLQLGSSIDPNQGVSSTTVSSDGTATLTASGGLVELFGTQATQGIGTVTLNSQTELRLRGLDVDSTARSTGAFNTNADVTINAQQVALTTATDYAITTDKNVTFGVGNASAATPLSAQATLTVNASTINQQGVIRVPFGHINLKASKAINLYAGSVTSVSGDDLLVPYGATKDGGKTWQYNGADVTKFIGKAITVDATGQTITADAGAQLNLNGGGKLVAWEFVPGPGGSKDNFLGAANGAFAIVPTIHDYAPYDSSIVLQGAFLNPAAGNALSLGNTLTFGAGGVLPAGTYAVLPARYALLPGAFLIQPNSSVSNVALGYARPGTDGLSQIMSAVKGVAGVGVAGNALPAAYTVRTSEQARRFSEIRNTDLDTYLTNKAVTAGTALPALMRDAGRLSLIADTLALDAQIQFKHIGQSKGGQLDIASQNIHVGDPKDAAQGYLNLTYAQLNASGADSILLGGVREDTDENGVTKVKATSGKVEVGLATPLTPSELLADPTKNQAISVGDLILAAADTVSLTDGARLQSADSSVSAQNLAFDGNGALLRVSSDVSATSTRSGTIDRSLGTLALSGQNIQIKGGSITAEGTAANTVNSEVLANNVIKSQALTLGASHIVVGDADSTAYTDQPLVINSKLASQLNQAKDLTLRSFSTVDMLGTSQLGSSDARNLTVDSAAIQLIGDAAKATLTAGAVTVANTTGATSTATTGDGILTVQATGANGGSGHVSLASGNVAISGVQSTNLTAAGSVVMKGRGGLTVPGDLSLNAQTLTAGKAANGALTATGAFSLDQGTGSAAVASTGAGSALQIKAASVAQRGNIVLPSGKLAITSDQSVEFGATSVTNLAGLAKTIDGQALTTMGGDLSVTANAGDITLAKGGVLNVSAGLGKSSAGSMTFSAPNGSVDLQGSLLATSASGQTGGSLSIDAQHAIDIAVLAQRINSANATGVNNFAQSISLRNRLGDQHVDAQSQPSAILAAKNIALSADAGTLTVAGALYANGDSGGMVSLNAGTNVEIADGADVQAKALSTGGTGGTVKINAVSGNISLNGGAIDVSGQGTDSDGVLALRALRNGNDLNIDTINTTLTGVGSVNVEAVKVYKNKTTLTSADITGFKSDARTYLDANGDAIAKKLAASQGELLGKLHLRGDAEVRSSGNMKVASGLMLTNYLDVLGQDPAIATDRAASGAPLNLTLRAAGDLTVAASISDGFSSTPKEQTQPTDDNPDPTPVPDGAPLPRAGAAADIRLIGGADLNAADLMSTRASSAAGDVIIGSGTSKTSPAVVVRTTTGSIDIAAGRDVKLLSNAAVYTTGAPVSSQNLVGYLKPASSLFVDQPSQETPFFSGGGHVSVKARRDVVGATSGTTQATTGWISRSRDASTGQVYWGSRYDKYQQGFATFGGGDIKIAAGRDAWRVNADVASSGYVTSDGTTVNYGGGSATLTAGQDVIGGVVAATENATVQAGRSVTNRSTVADNALAASALPTQSLALFYGDGNNTVQARDDLTLESVQQIGSLPNGLTVRAMFRPVGQATLDVAATAGDLTFRGTGNILPGSAVFTAASGNAELSTFIQAPALQTKLSVLAQGDIDFGNVTQIGIEGLPESVLWASNSDSTYAALDKDKLSGAGSSPTRIVAEEGSIHYGVDTIQTHLITPLRMIAGQDLIGGGAGAGLYVQHQDANDVSLIQAGRDFNLSTGFGVFLNGPGDLVVATGRNLDLSTSSGIQARGNLDNAALPSGKVSAGITVLTGASFAAGDITNAVNAYYPLLGSMVDPKWIYTQIKTGEVATPSTVAAAQSQAQSDLATNGILDLAIGLAGQQAYQDAVLGFVNHRVDASQTLTQALDTFKSASAHDQALVAGQLLAKVWASNVPAAVRNSQVLGLANPGSIKTQALVDFVAARTGKDNTKLSLADALDAYTRMPVEQQALLVTQTLSKEVAAAIVDAASKTGGDREAAYVPGYDALSTVFPHASNELAQIDMGASAIKTYQNSPIGIYNLNGGLNVGQLVQGGRQTAGELGIVTAGGGDISVLARDNVAVNTSRIFTLLKGDETIWSSLGNVDAGRGAKTATSTPTPVYYFDPVTSQIKVDITAAVSGSGILATGSARIAAPKGEINAGDAGIAATGDLFFGALRFVGGDNVSAGSIVGAPPPPAVNLAAVATTPTQPTAAGTSDDKSKEEGGKAKKRKRNVLLDFLGFGSGDDTDKTDK